MNNLAFNYVATLASVVNALGIVRFLVRLSEYLQRGNSIRIKFDWTYALLAVHQFLLHVLLWWLLWGIRETTNFYYVTYLYMLMGPILLFLGTSLLTPEIVDDEVHLPELYRRVRPTYSTTLILVWLWAIFTRPVFHGEVAPATSIFLLYLFGAILLRITSNRTANLVLTIGYWILFAAYLSLYGGNFGGPGGSPA